MRYAFRLLKKTPAFSAVAVLTLALGIGANTALFSLVNAMLLKQLPFEHAERLVWIWSTRTDRDKAFYSLPDFVETRAQLTTLDGLGAYANWGANLSGRGDAERLNGARVTANGFTLLGVTALHGRTLLTQDGEPAAERVVLLSFGLWQRRFGADPGIVGQRLILANDSYTVAGVLPAAFAMPATDAELFVPLVIDTDPLRSDRETNFLRTFARLKQGVTPRQASADLAAIERRLREAHPKENGKHTDPRVLAFLDEIVGGYRAALWTLLGAVGLVLLIACANLANLLLTRASARAREVAIRSALGATRAALVRQFLGESLLLAALGGSLGVLLARAGLRILLTLSPAGLPRASEVALDGRVLIFAIAVTVMAGLIFGLAPALHATRAGWGDELRTRTAGLGARGTLRDSFAVAEVALSIVLLTGAGLLLQSFLRTQAVNPGIATDRLLLIRLSLPKDRYSTPASLRKFYDTLSGRVAALPGVTSAALGSVLPLSGMNVRSEFFISGRTPASPLDVPAAQNRWVSAGYFRVLGIPIVQGREFSAHDLEDSAGVAAVDRALAGKYWPGRSPLGQHFRMMGRDYEVVAVVGDVKHNTLDDAPTATIYAPFPQATPGTLSFLLNGFSLVVRTTSDPMALASAVRRELRAVDSGVPPSSVKTMDQFLSAAVAPRRFNLELMMTFAGAALLLAAMGLYGVISYSVSLRTGEIGIRMALGADRAAILRMIAGHALRLVVIGIALGAGLAMLAANVARSLLFQTSAADPLTFAIVAALFTAVGISAACVPARRAMRVDPWMALRRE